MAETAESELAKCEEEVSGDIIAADLRALTTEFKRAIARVKQMPTFLKLRNSSVRRGAPVFVTRTELPPSQGSVRAICNSCQAEGRTARSVRCLGVAFLSEECGDSTNGLRYNVVLADDMDPRQINFVLAHEVAHVVLGHCDRRYPKERALPMLNTVSLDPPDDLPFPASPQGHGLYDMRDFNRCPSCDAPNPLSRRRKTLIRHKALVESEAEATAFLVMASTALTEAGNSSSLLDDAAKYIARHGGTGKLLLLQKQRILAAASRIAPLFRTL